MKKKILTLLAATAVMCGAALAVGCGSHALYKVDATEASCTVDGNIEYYKCYVDGCGKYFTDEHGNDEISLEDTVVKAGGHKTIAVGEAVEPTCTENGLTAGEKCSVCGTLVAEQQVVTFTGHKPKHMDGKAATCETDGNIEHYECSDCGKYFSDDKCVVEIANVRLKALGHAFGEWEHIAGDKHKKVCANDGSHVQTESCRFDKTSDFTDGTGHYLTCVVCDGKSEKKPHDIKWFIDGNEHWSECRTCEYASDRAEHAPVKLTVEIVGKKLYGGRTMSASDISVVSICECGHETALGSDDIVFDDVTLADGENTLSVGYGQYTQEFTYDAPVEPRFTLKVVGATFDDGGSELTLKEGDKVTQTPITAGGKTFVGFLDGLTVSDDLSAFIMPDRDHTVYALYEEDMIPFTPANKTQGGAFGDETFEHVTLDNGIVATRFVWDDEDSENEQIKKPHSASENSGMNLNVSSPAKGESLMFIYVVNNGDKDIDLTWMAENYGPRGQVAITAKAHSTTRMPLVYGDDTGYGTFSTCDHWIELVTERQTGETIELDFYGRIAATENNNRTIGISAKLDKTDYVDGDKIDLSSLRVTARLNNGYNLNIPNGYTCNVTDGQDYTSDIKRITVDFGGCTTWFDINSEFSDWIHATAPANPKDGWLTAEHITDAATGLPSTRFVFKAGTAANSDTYTDPTPDKGIGAGYNTSMPQYVGKTRVIKLFVKNTSGQTLKFRAYWENYGDIGGANVELDAGESGVYDIQITASGNYGTTTGCRINIKLLEGIGESDASFEMYTMYKAFDNEMSGISVEPNSKHKTTFAVGETFDASKLELKVSSSLGSAGNVRITNNITTDFDGRTFTADDVGEHTVTVVWNGLPTTYKITVTA